MNALSVSTLVSYLKRKLDADDRLTRVEVTGEISNYHRHSSGHLYFTLKDEYSQISCAMFRSYTTTLRFEPKNGDKVLVVGNVSLFEKSGQLQLYVSRMEADGLGMLYQRYEALKKKLLEEGYFDASHKKEQPFIYPERIAVFVGENSAAMSDIKRGFRRRWPLTEVDYYPVLVQGIEAPKDIIENLLIADEKGYDAIILARGGGSFEDLFCFNDEGLVKTIYSLKTFLVSGIGHEQDFTLADFVADLRAATPTAAVELITPDIDDVLEDIETYEDTLASLMEEKIMEQKDPLKKLLSSKTFLQPLSIIESRELTFDYLLERLKGTSSVFREAEKKIDLSLSSMDHSLKISLERFFHLLQEKELRIHTAEEKKRIWWNTELRRYSTLIKAYSAENVLKRGFSLIYKDGKIILSKKDLSVQDEIEVRMKDGAVKAEVKEV